MVPTLLSMLAPRVDHRKISWRLRWRTFGTVVFLHPAYSGPNAALKVAEVSRCSYSYPTVQ